MEEVNKKMKKKKERKKVKSATSDLSLRILALIIAVISWFALSITQYPTITKTVSGIHVDFDMTGTIAAEKGLEALNYNDITVVAEIKGMNYEIGTYTANDLRATVDLDSVTKEGKYRLDIDVRSTHSTDRVNIISVRPEYIEVEFDRMTNKTVEVTADAPMISAEDGFTLKESSVSPGTITLEGPSNELEKITRAVAKVSSSARLSEDTSFAADEIIFYDEDDNIVEPENVTMSESDYTVDFVIHKKKTVELVVDITNKPEGFDETSLPMVLSDSSVSVTTPDLTDNDTDIIHIGSIPLNKIDLSNKETFDVTLEPDDINLTGITTVTVSFDSKGYSFKKLNVSSSKFDIVNIPSGYEVDTDSMMLSNVVVFGPEDILDTLTENDLKVRIDLSDIATEGDFYRSAVVYSPKYNNIWCYGDYSVQISVNRPEEETGDSSSQTE